MVYDQSPTDLAFALLPVFATLWYLSQLVGYEEWQQIKHRRRRHLIDISISYLSRARLGQSNLLVEAISRHLFDLTTLTRETHITAYTCRYLDEGHRAEYLGEVEAARARYFQEDRILNMASCQWEVDPAGSAKRGKKTNQLIFEYDSVRICAFHLQIATKSELKQGEYLREWAGTLEVPLSAALEAFEALGLSLGQEQGLEKETMEAMQDALESLKGESFEAKMTKILISEKIALALVALPPVVPTACKVPHVVFGMHPRAPEWSVEQMLEKVAAEKNQKDTAMQTTDKTVTCIEMPTPRPMKGFIRLHTGQSIQS
eukprot:s7293_g1.t1